jgi:hypothetical protein
LENPLRPKEVKFITIYSAHLCDAIKHKDADAFVALLSSDADLPQNINTDAPINLPGFKISGDSPTRAQAAHDFLEVTSRLEKRFGNLSNVRCAQIYFQIAPDWVPYRGPIGFFQFDVTLKLEGNGHFAYLLQGNNFLTNHGVRWGQMPQIEDYASLWEHGPPIDGPYVGTITPN